MQEEKGVEHTSLSRFKTSVCWFVIDPYCAGQLVCAGSIVHHGVVLLLDVAAFYDFS